MILLFLFLEGVEIKKKRHSEIKANHLGSIRFSSTKSTD